MSVRPASNSARGRSSICLGPLSNPAGVTPPVAWRLCAAMESCRLREVMRDLGSESVWVVHGNGLDEITTGKTECCGARERQDPHVRTVTRGFRRRALPRLEAIQKAETVWYNAAALRDALEQAPRTRIATFPLANMRCRRWLLSSATQSLRTAPSTAPRDPQTAVRAAARDRLDCFISKS